MCFDHRAIIDDNKTLVNDNGDIRHVRLGDTLKIATWNCGGLSHTQRDLCGQLGYDILALTETHDSGCIRSTKHLTTGDTAPRGDPCAGVAMLFSDRIAEKSVIHSGCCGPPELEHHLATCLLCVYMYRIVPDKTTHNQTH